MDADWLFTKSDPPNAQSRDFNATDWRHLNVPHDWSIEGPFDEKNPTGGAGGFLPAGVGWYRKHFTLPAEFAGRNVFIEFDGVMANSDVWINNTHLGHRPYGYVGFRYELTGHLDFGPGKTNVLAVRADKAAQPASRWYSGAGVYRHVRLIVTDPLHFDHWATFISTPEVSSNQATIHCETTVANQSGRSHEAKVALEINGPGLSKPETVETAVQHIGSRGTARFQADIVLKKPRVWNLTAPTLYTASAILKTGGKTFDRDDVPFGIREARFEPDTGFWFNGSNLKIKGVCLHHDCGALGAAVPISAWERRLNTLKQLGCNAIRTAHNPPAPDFLDLCDRMGFLVMDEMFDCWTVAKNRYDYHLYFEEFCDWTPRNFEPHDEEVEVYSNCEEVELLLNGKTLGRKTLPPDASPQAWTVRFVPGVLSAIARSNGQQVAMDELLTAGKPARPASKRSAGILVRIGTKSRTSKRRSSMSTASWFQVLVIWFLSRPPVPALSLPWTTATSPATNRFRRPSGMRGRAAALQFFALRRRGRLV